MQGPDAQHLIVVGETIARSVRWSRDDIAAFARFSGDANPLHLDVAAAQRARFGEIIVSGQQTASFLMGMLASHFSRADDGVARQMVCLNMNFAFKRALFAEQDAKLGWRVATVEWNNTLNGMLGHLDGFATVGGGKPAVVARGTILVSEEGS